MVRPMVDPDVLRQTFQYPVDEGFQLPRSGSADLLQFIRTTK